MAIEWLFLGINAAFTALVVSLVLFASFKLLKPAMRRYGSDMMNLAKAQAMKGIEEAVGGIDMGDLEAIAAEATDENGKLDIQTLMNHPLAQQFLSGKSNAGSPLAGLGPLGELMGMFQMLAQMSPTGGPGGSPGVSSPGPFRPGIR